MQKIVSTFLFTLAIIPAAGCDETALRGSAVEPSELDDAVEVFARPALADGGEGARVIPLSAPLEDEGAERPGFDELDLVDPGRSEFPCSPGCYYVQGDTPCNGQTNPQYCSFDYQVCNCQIVWSGCACG